MQCRVSPILCVRNHRETVTRRLYLDQSFIQLQMRCCCCMCIVFFRLLQSFSARYRSVARESLSPAIHITQRGFRTCKPHIWFISVKTGGSHFASHSQLDAEAVARCRKRAAAAPASRASLRARKGCCGMFSCVAASD